MSQPPSAECPAVPAQAHSFADLPPEILHHIFGTLLPSVQPLPLQDVAQQWMALQLTCKAWQAAMQHMPVAVEACLPPPGSLRWLQERVTLLRLLPPEWDLFPRPAGLDDEPPAGLHNWFSERDLRMVDWVTRRCGLPRSDALWGSGPKGANDAFVSCYLAYLDFIPLLMEGLAQAPPEGIGYPAAAAGAPLLALAACDNLQVWGSLASGFHADQPCAALAMVVL